MKFSWRNPYIIGATVVIIIGGWWFFARPKTNTTAPVTAQVQTGTLVETVTGTGNLTPKIQADVSTPDYGRIDALYVKNGDEVTADQALLKFHSLATPADKAKALASLLSAEDSYNQALTKTSSLNASLASAQQAAQDAQKNEQIAANTLAADSAALSKTKNDATANSLDAQQAVTNAQITQSKAGDDLSTQSANLGAQSAQLGVKSSAFSNKQSIASATATYEGAQRDQASVHLKTVAAQNSLTVAQQNLSNQQTSIAAAAANLTASRLNYQLLSDETVTAPVAGRIVNSSLTIGETVGSQGGNSSSNSTVTVTPTQLFSIIDFSSMKAVVSVSEVDIANVQLNQPATLTFDALAGKTYTGHVTNIDTVGTTTQGVTSYNVEITLDSLPPELKPGMSVTASIVTKQKPNVLLVPSSAIRTSGGQSTVTILVNGQQQTVPVTLGDSNDTDTEITGGLKEGDTIVTSGGTSPTSTTTGRSVFSGTGGGFGGGFGGGGGGNRAVIRPGG